MIVQGRTQSLLARQAGTNGRQLSRDRSDAAPCHPRLVRRLLKPRVNQGPA